MFLFYVADRPECFLVELLKTGAFDDEITISFRTSRAQAIFQIIELLNDQFVH